MQDQLYDRLVAAGCEVDNHESDLYVRDTPEARRVIEGFEVQFYNDGLTQYRFIHQVTGEPWLDLPFMYSPWWRKRGLAG
jgi:hypothetical protein